MGTRAALCLASTVAFAGFAHAHAPLVDVPAAPPVALHQIVTDPARILDTMVNQPFGILDAARVLMHVPAEERINGLLSSGCPTLPPHRPCDAD